MKEKPPSVARSRTQPPMRLSRYESRMQYKDKEMIPLNDTRPQYETLKPDILRVSQAVMEKSWFILGENVAAFEREFADYCGTKHAIGVSNGTDAIHLACAALGIGPGDEVLTSPHTATFTAL